MEEPDDTVGASARGEVTPDVPTLRIPVRVELRREAPAPAPAPPPGSGPKTARRLAGRYRIEEEIGRGGMGVVYRAFDRDLRRHVAMKVMLEKLGVESDIGGRFVEEAQATAQLQHPGIVPVYEIGLDDEGTLFFTMKLVRGRTLAKVVEQVRAGDSETAREHTPFRWLQVFIEVCRAVFFAHERGVVHRDLKPPSSGLRRTTRAAQGWPRGRRSCGAPESGGRADGGPPRRARSYGTGPRSYQPTFGLVGKAEAERAIEA